MITVLMIVAGSILTQTALGGDLSVVVTGASEAKFPAITMEFEIRRPDGSFLIDAKQRDIRVTEDSRPMSILRFQAPSVVEPMPTTVVLVVDRSGSMMIEDRIGNLKEAVAMFMRRMPPTSRVAVVAFGSEVQTICSFTDDAEEVCRAVNALYPEGSTRFYDAVDWALRMLEKESGRRAVLALTDGADTSSELATLDSVIVSARRLGLPVHTLGLGGEMGTFPIGPIVVLVALGILAWRIRRRSSNAKARFAERTASGCTGCVFWVALLVMALIVLGMLVPSPEVALRQLAEKTRGQYYPARQAYQLHSIYDQLAERLRSSYSLSYLTDHKIPDGTLRPVSVSYRDSGKVGITKVFIPGMVVPAGGWSPLFLALVGTLTLLALLPGYVSRRYWHR